VRNVGSPAQRDESDGLLPVVRAELPQLPPAGAGLLSAAPGDSFLSAGRRRPGRRGATADEL